ncbi:glutamine--tRNA ligase [Plakobranchus ocellatus]|uniref:glutamine--tRNA ligase n=1 Tax=Plakobranchus ocellatus TaxID=259542 RepID=A0AAV4BA86_9GAST|nr:glutamine--tRNA ligase [Plakobranchus ocellatus]
MSEAEARPSNFIRQIIDKDLADGKHTSVHTRFPPEPNGYLHIGHAKSICLNFGIAQDYQGQCNLRFDDTNPEKEDVEYVESIKNDVSWLGFEWSGDVCYSSNYFDKLYEYAVELINKGLAYVDELSPEQIREYRGTLTAPGKPSPYRDRSVEENLALFEKMRDGGFEEGTACLRAKIDMSSSFMVMRDPVLYRVRFAHHHQTGDKWCIYPMYDFTHCISDALEGITHSLCTLEFQDNRRLYDWVLENITIDCQPHQYEFSRLNLEYTVMSKRKLNQLVTEKLVNGWDDPHPVKIVIENYQGEGETLSIANHPNKPEMGTREVPFTREVWIEREDFREEANKKYKRLVLGKEVRLRGAYVIKAERIEKDEAGNITTIFCSYDADTLGKNPADGRKVKGVIHWVSADKGLPAEIRLYDRLFTVANPAAADNFAETINPESLVVSKGFVEPSLAAADASQGYQFERMGYFCADIKDSSAESLVFNRTVGLRDTWAKVEAK